MRVRAGTSGWAYDEWRGSFYPQDLPKDGMLAFYASVLPAVEVNNTFYRMPKKTVVAGWRAQAPRGFGFVLKASRRITHMQRLRDAADPVRFLFSVAGELGEALGPVLFQLPPVLRKDAALLRDFLSVVPAGRRIALEFRHASWFDDETYAALSERGAALCGGESDEYDGELPLVTTGRFGYLRLRAPDYDEVALGAWAERVRRQPWDEAWVFFKHEQKGPALARRFNELTGGVAS
jgi:uncharacterized protein YecE (DUF72 family)